MMSWGITAKLANVSGKYDYSDYSSWTMGATTFNWGGTTLCSYGPYVQHAFQKNCTEMRNAIYQTHNCNDKMLKTEQEESFTTIIETVQHKLKPNTTEC